MNQVIGDGNTVGIQIVGDIGAIHGNIGTIIIHNNLKNGASMATAWNSARETAQAIASDTEKHNNTNTNNRRTAKAHGDAEAVWNRMAKTIHTEQEVRLLRSSLRISNGTLQVFGKLLVLAGNLTLDHLTVCSDGAITVFNDLLIDNGSNIHIRGGILIVHGDIMIRNGSVLTNDASITVGGRIQAEPSAFVNRRTLNQSRHAN